LALYFLGGSKVKAVRAFISCIGISRLKFFMSGPSIMAKAS